MNTFEYFVCTKCDACIPKNLAFQEKISNEDHDMIIKCYEEFNEKLKRLNKPTIEFVTPEEENSFWHSLNIFIGAGGGRIGGHTQTIICGPLREPDQSDKEIELLENMLGTSLRK